MPASVSATALLVSRGDRLRDLPPYEQCVVDRDCAARDTLCKVGERILMAIAILCRRI